MRIRLAGSPRAVRWSGTLAALALGGWLASPLAFAAEDAATQTQPAAPETPADPGTAAVDPSLIDPAAREAVVRMVATLHDAQRMSFEFESSFDALQDDGEVLEFGSSGEVTIRRPDRLRGETLQRSGNRWRYAWNGTNLVLLDEKQNVYASTPRSGDIDSLVDFLRDDVGMKLPIADLFMTDLRQLLIDHVIAARYLGKQILDEVETEHVALRMRTGVDVQLWIKTGKHALPARMVLNFATADGRPQFRASFDDWDLDPSVRDGLFELDLPKGARVVPFALRPRPVAGSAVQEEIQ
jgi:hypothetical protein